MSGGHWDYMSYKLEDRARVAGPVWRLLAEFEHALDWGYSGDTCLDCAERRVSKALAAFFDDSCEDISKALAVARDSRQNLCPACEEREAKRGTARV